MTPVGFPHSDIHGSLPAFGFPWLFVDRYVLLRLPVPRHPPCALLSLTSLCLFDPALQSRSNHFFGFSLAIPSHLVAQCAGIFFSHIHTFLYLCALLHILSFLLYSVFKVLLSAPTSLCSPVVGSNGLEPSTSRLSGVRSNHLSYEPMSLVLLSGSPVLLRCRSGFAPLRQLWWR